MQRRDASLVMPNVTVAFSKRNYVWCPSNSRLGMLAMVVLLLPRGLWAASTQVELKKPSSIESSSANDEQVEVKTVSGQLVMVKRHQISVENVRKDKEGYAHEYLLPLAEDVRLNHVREFSELQKGDTVQVTYHTIYRVDEKGERVDLKTIATEITLLKAASTTARLNVREQL